MNGDDKVQSREDRRETGNEDTCSCRDDMSVEVVSRKRRGERPACIDSA